MTIKLFNGSNWNNFARRIRIHAGSTWTNGIKSLKVYRDPGSSPFWDIAYPDLPVGTSPTVYANGIQNSSAAPGSVFSVNANMGNQDPLVFINTDSSDYIRPQSVTYQWQRSSSTSGPWSNVGSSTTTYSNYSIQESDLGYYFRLQSIATNAKGSTTVNSFASGIVEDPRYVFNFGVPFGLNANAFIMFDSQGATPFPSMDYLGFPFGRWLGYFVGDWKHYDVFYRSDANTFRIYHRLYRNDQVRADGPTIEYEIVFTAGSNIVDVYVTNTVATSFITSLNAYTKTFSFSGSYNLSDYNIGTRYRVTMTNPVSISTTRLSTDVSSNSVPIISASITNNVATITTSQNHNLLSGYRTCIYGLTGSYAVLNGNWTVTEIPSGTVFKFSRTNSNLASSSVSGYATHPPSYPPLVYFGGWIDLGLFNDSTDGTYTFSSGSGQFSPILTGVNGAFNKSNMFWPNQVQLITTTYQSSTSATVSWANAGTNSAFNAGSYSIEVKRNDNNVIVDGPRLVTSTNTTINNLVLGQGYTISISPNSRSDGGGQFSFTNTATYNHATIPAAPTSLTATVNSDTQVTLTWSEPANNGSAITGYTVQYKRNIDASWTTWATNAETDRNAPITGLTGSTLYNFRVAAVNGIGTGPYATVNATTNAPASPPGAPTNLSVTSPGLIGSLISWTLNWTAPTSNGGATITNYEYRIDTDASGPNAYSAWTNVGNVLNTSILINSGLQAFVQVRAVNSAGAGAASSTLTVPSSPSKPGTPIAGSINSTNAQSTIQWTASNINGGSSLLYRVYRGQNATSVNTERTNTTNGTTSNFFTDNISGTATSYFYRVVAENTLQSSPNTVKGFSPTSDTSSVLSVSQPSVNTPNTSITNAAPPTNNSRGITISWSGNAGSGSALNYRVYRGQAAANVNNPLGTANQTDTSFFDTTVASGTEYFYKVIAGNNITNVTSGTSSGRTTPGAPSANTPTKNATNSSNVNNNLAISWTGSGTGTITYEVFRSQNTTGSGQSQGTQQSTNYSFNYGTGAFTYYFRIVPSSEWGTGAQTAWSAAMSVS